MKIILASNSPRRKELLSLIVQDFEVMPSNIDEKLDENLTYEKQVENLSYKKAKDIFDKTSGDRIVIGSDTLVTKNNKIYGKPKDREDAKNMIKELTSGDKIHSVYTGLCIIIEKSGVCKQYKTFDEVKIYLKDMTDSEIEKWLNTGKAMDKAGAYGIQNEFCVFVDKIDGNYDSVVGFPIHKVYDIIKNYLN